MSRNFRPSSFPLILIVVFAALSIGFLARQAISQSDRVELATEQVPTEKTPTDEAQNRYPNLFPHKSLKPDTNDNELRKLQIARFNEANKEWLQLNGELVTGGAPRSLRPILELMFDASMRAKDARLELSRNSKEDLELLEEYVTFTKDIEKNIEARVEDGREDRSLATKARYLRLDAEIQLLKAKQKQKK